MLNVEWLGQDTICIQMTHDERESFAIMLERLLASEESTIVQAGECELEFSIFDEIVFDAREQNHIRISFRKENCVDLIESIREHINDDQGFPLDYSLEAYCGFEAKLYPETLRDIVIETVGDYDYGIPDQTTN